MEMNTTNGHSFKSIDLMRALYDIQDILERALCPFILLGDTARSIQDKEQLEGDGIYIGVIKKNVTKEAMSTMKFYLEHSKQVDFTDNGFTYEWNGVPINVTFIKKHYEFFDRPDFRFYMASEYSIPNPLDAYWKVRHFIS